MTSSYRHAQLFPMLLAALFSFAHQSSANEPGTGVPATQPVERTRPSTQPAAPTPERIVDLLTLNPAGPMQFATRHDDRGLTRGGQYDTTLVLLAPGYTGRTMADHPVLYFHLSKATGKAVVATLTESGCEQPAVKWEFRSGLGEGFHALQLRADDPPLKPGMTYEWTVAVLEKAATRSKSNDQVQTFIIERVPADEALAGRLHALPHINRVEILARAGLFYDAASLLMLATNGEGDLLQPAKYREALLGAVSGSAPGSESTGPR